MRINVIHIVGVMVCIVLVIIVTGGVRFFSGDFGNKMSRLQIEYTDGDYMVTYAVDNYSKSWNVVDDKVTSVPDKGYYFFWATDLETNERFYVQAPMMRTYVEQVVSKKKKK